MNADFQPPHNFHRRGTDMDIGVQTLVNNTSVSYPLAKLERELQFYTLGNGGVFLDEPGNLHIRFIR